MKFVAILIISVAALCSAQFAPIEEMPGFWDGRDESLRAIFESSKLDRGGRITNGEIAAEGQFPYMGFLLITVGAQQFICGSSIIGPTTVLTAVRFSKLLLNSNQF